MTESRLDPRIVVKIRGAAMLRSASLATVLLAACHAGLPPEPPGADPADPAAAAAPYQVHPNPYDTSAFAGEPTPAANEHAGHNMNHGSSAGDKQGPAPAAPMTPEHAGHANMPRQEAPR